MNNMLCNVVSLAMAYLQVQPLPVCCGSDKDGDSVTWSIGLIMFLGRILTFRYSGFYGLDFCISVFFLCSLLYQVSSEFPCRC